MTSQLRQPSAWYYGLAVAVVIIGGVAGGWVLFNQLSRLTEGLQQVSVPGEIEVTLAEPGTYTIFHEYQSVVEDWVYRNEEGLPGLKVAFVSAGGAPVALSPGSVSSNYSVGGRAGVSVLGFSTDEPGPYRLSAWYPEGQGGPQGVLGEIQPL